MLGYPGALDAGERMQQTRSQTFQLLEPNTALFGTRLSQGSSGDRMSGIWASVPRGRSRSSRIVLVGIMSFGSVERQLAGTSIINGDFEEIFNATCEAEPGNCVDPGIS